MLFLGGRREILAPTLAEAVGEGVEVDIMSRELGDCINRAEDQLLEHRDRPPSCVASFSRMDVVNEIMFQGGLPPKGSRIDKLLIEQCY